MTSPVLDWETIWFSLYWRDQQPTAKQQEIIDCFKAGQRRILIAGGERGGKSRVAAYLAGLKMGPASLTDQSTWGEVKRFWFVGATYLASRVEFQYVHDALRDGGFIASTSMAQTNNQAWSLTTTWGVHVETRTGFDTSRLASYSIHGALMCEAGSQDPNVLNKLYGRVSETRGWIMLIGTFEDNYPWYEMLWERWQASNADGGISFSLPSWSNLAVYPGGYDNPEIVLLRNSVPEDWFARRYAAVPVKSSELVIPEFDFKTHVRELERVEDVPVQLAIDPGKNAYAVLFMQHIGAISYVLDVIYTRGQIAQVVIPEVMGHPLWRYVDKEPNSSVIDIAGTQAPGGESQWAIWRKMANLSLGFKYCKQKDTREQVRFRLRVDPVLNLPLTFFSDKLKTGYAADGTATEFLSEFALWKWPKYTVGMNEKPEPIDANNHGIKALGYKFIQYYGIEHERRITKAQQVRRKGWNQGSERGLSGYKVDGIGIVANRNEGRYYRRRNWMRNTNKYDQQ